MDGLGIYIICGGSEKESCFGQRFIATVMELFNKNVGKESFLGNIINNLQVTEDSK